MADAAGTARALRLFDEIAEQPEVAARLLESAVPAVRALAAGASIRRRLAA